MEPGHTLNNVFFKNYSSQSVQLYYHEIKTILRLHEFCIHDRLLKCQITKIVITRIQYTFQWDAKLKLHRVTPILTPIVMKFWAIICQQKATFQVIPEYLSESFLRRSTGAVIKLMS